MRTLEDLGAGWGMRLSGQNANEESYWSTNSAAAPQHTVCTQRRKRSNITSAKVEISVSAILVQSYGSLRELIKVPKRELT